VHLELASCERQTRSISSSTIEQHPIDPVHQRLELAIVRRTDDEHAAAFGRRKTLVVEIVLVDGDQGAAQLLRHAFETLDCIAVEFRTHVLNSQSRKGIERLGAKLDGILRRHMIQPNGTLRDTAVYSITAEEWPMVKAHLDWQLTRPR